MFNGARLSFLAVKSIFLASLAFKFQVALLIAVLFAVLRTETISSLASPVELLHVRLCVSAIRSKPKPVGLGSLGSVNMPLQRALSFKQEICAKGKNVWLC